MQVWDEGGGEVVRKLIIDVFLVYSLNNRVQVWRIKWVADRQMKEGWIVFLIHFHLPSSFPSHSFILILPSSFPSHTFIPILPSSFPSYLFILIIPSSFLLPFLLIYLFSSFLLPSFFLSFSSFLLPFFLILSSSFPSYSFLLILPSSFLSLSFIFLSFLASFFFIISLLLNLLCTSFQTHNGTLSASTSITIR